jgi:hypothetical protein
VITALFVLLAIALTVMIVVIVVVSLSSKLEDSKWTLGGPPPGPIRVLAQGSHRNLN